MKLEGLGNYRKSKREIKTMVVTMIVKVKEMRTVIDT